MAWRFTPYVWMTNHTHLLASPAHAESSGKFFQSVGRKYVQYFNFSQQPTGTLWEGRYRATVIDSESYLMTVMRYIEMNPVRAGLVTHPSEHTRSSYACNALGEAGANSDWMMSQGCTVALPRAQRIGKARIAACSNQRSANTI
jgi:putative transposase